MGKHAFLSASKYHWVNYDEDKLVRVYGNHLAAQEGTELHELSSTLIRKRIKLPRSQKTLNMYVNDAIGFRMVPEQILFYSNNAFGTCDAISFRKDFLRIHDLKTGVTRSSVKQLEVYTALFCLEYRIKPSDIQIELRIYQEDEVQIFEPELEDLVHIMDRIITFDKRINALNVEVMS